MRAKMSRRLSGTFASSAKIVSREMPGKIRQLMFARARCGSVVRNTKASLPRTLNYNSQFTPVTSCMMDSLSSNFHRKTWRCFTAPTKLLGLLQRH
jgi:hypothetical protein